MMNGSDEDCEHCENPCGFARVYNQRVTATIRIFLRTLYVGDRPSMGFAMNAMMFSHNNYNSVGVLLWLLC